VAAVTVTILRAKPVRRSLCGRKPVRRSLRAAE